MIRRLFIFCAFVLSLSVVAQQRPTQAILLWPNGAPGAVGMGVEDTPTLTPFWPSGSASGAVFIVCPGGAYWMLADHEGAPVARWLNTLGIAAFVLKYRHAPLYHYPSPQQDAMRAIKTVRANAQAWGVDGKRIGILGFSAGGHLAASVSTHFDPGGNPRVLDPVERVSSRPDLSVLIYPVITMIGPYAHGFSKANLIGAFPEDDLDRMLSNQEQVNAGTPPTFLVHTMDDNGVPVENSLMYAEALRRAGVDFEMHIFQHGAHGFGLGGNDPALSMWPKLCAEWLRLHGFVAHP